MNQLSQSIHQFLSRVNATIKMARYHGVWPPKGEAQREFFGCLWEQAKKGVTRIHFSPDDIKQMGTDEFYRECSKLMKLPESDSF